MRALFIIGITVLWCLVVGAILWYNEGARIERLQIDNNLFGRSNAPYLAIVP